MPPIIVILRGQRKCVKLVPIKITPMQYFGKIIRVGFRAYELLAIGISSDFNAEMIKDPLTKK